MTSRVETGVDSRRGRWSSPEPWTTAFPNCTAIIFRTFLFNSGFLPTLSDFGHSGILLGMAVGWLGWQFWDGGR